MCRLLGSTARRRRPEATRANGDEDLRAVNKRLETPPRELWLLGLVAVVHVLLVVSVLGQPISLPHPDVDRSLTWSLHFDSVHRGGPAADFFAVYHAGVNLSRGLSPYLQEEEPQRTPYHFPFRYLPLVGQTLGRAAQQLEPAAAWRAWGLVLELLLVALCVAVWRRADGTTRPLLIALLLLSVPYFLELHMGQFTFAAVALLVLGLLHLERLAWSVPLLTAAAWLKVFPLVAIPALLRERRGAQAAAAWVALVALGGGAYFLGHGDDWRIFLERNFARPVGGMDSGNHSPLYAVLLVGARLGVEWSEANWFPLLSAVRFGVLGVTVVCVLGTRLRDPRVLASGLVLAHFVSYAHFWEHHVSGLVPLGVLLTLAAPARRSAAVALTLTVLLALPTPFFGLDPVRDVFDPDPGQRWTLGARLLLLGSKAVPAVALYLLAVTWMLRAGLRLPGAGARRARTT